MSIYFFGGYPGSLPLRGDMECRLSCMTDSIINPGIPNDVIGLERITKPALMSSILCHYSSDQSTRR